MKSWLTNVVLKWLYNYGEKWLINMTPSIKSFIGNFILTLYLNAKASKNIWDDYAVSYLLTIMVGLGIVTEVEANAVRNGEVNTSKNKDEGDVVSDTLDEIASYKPGDGVTLSQA